MANKTSFDLYDALVLIGFALIEYGLGRWSAPAPFVMAGVVLMGVGLWPALRKARR